MGLFDRSRRRPDELPEHYVDLVRRLGKAEAEVERLSLVWESYRDELKRLVNRLEKRDQRAAAKTEGDCGCQEELLPLDNVSARIQRRRERLHGVQNGTGTRTG